MSSRTGKRNQCGVDIDSISITPSREKWLCQWLYHGSTFIHGKTFDHEGLAFEFKRTLIRESKGES
jgi:hypothetical protein